MSEHLKATLLLAAFVALGVLGVINFQRSSLNPANIDWTWPENCELAFLDPETQDHFICSKYKDKGDVD